MATLAYPEQKWYGLPPLFNPQDGETILKPEESGSGNWVGAPSIVYDSSTQRFYLYYRVRKPRPIRGGECYIAESTDGETFDTIWGVHKEALGTPSIERSCLIKNPKGEWFLYLSYVDPETQKWRIDVVQASNTGGFDLSQRQKVFTAEDVGVQGVKDPWVMIINGLYYMLISYAATLPNLSAQEQQRLHATGDVYNTGLTLSSTALALSSDGIHYVWKGEIFSPRQGAWDAYAARLGCLLPTGYGWVGYYDGSASVKENYEERTGIACTCDLRTFYRLSSDGPVLTSPEGSGSLRYIDALLIKDEIWFYYEYCRSDGSHELRRARIKR